MSIASVNLLLISRMREYIDRRLDYRLYCERINTSSTTKDLLVLAYSIIHEYNATEIARSLTMYEVTILSADRTLLPTYRKAIGTLFPESYSTAPITHIGNVDISAWEGGSTEAAKMALLDCYENCRQNLSLSHWSLTSLPWSALKQCSSLKHLGIFGCKIPVIIIPEELPFLETLHINANVETCSIIFLRSLPAMKSLTIMLNKALKDIHILEEMPALERITICVNRKLTTLTLPAQLPFLEHVDLHANDLGESPAISYDRL